MSRSIIILCFFCLLFAAYYDFIQDQVFVTEADYEFTVRFHEFRNPLGLQCGECGSGGTPACCDDVQRRENCNTTRPFTCDTRFRFMLRPFGAPVETAPNTGFPYFTPSHGGNSETFNEAPGGFVAYPNPFIIRSMGKWTGRTQFFIDALDRAVDRRTSGLDEMEMIINRFPIDLELNLGSIFTARTTYTGIYSISHLGFDMSFRVQCSENYYGLNCNMFCKPVKGEYSCDCNGRVVCIKDNRDPATNCTTCLPGYDPEQNCTQCLLGQTVMPSSCTACPPCHDISMNCETCLEASSGKPPISPLTEGALGGVLGLSVIINVVLVIVSLVLLVKNRTTRGSVKSLSLSDHVKEREGGTHIDMNSNLSYTLRMSDSIVTKPNMVYGVTTSNELSDLKPYEYVQ